MNKQDTQPSEDQENEKVLADGPSKKNLKKIISEAKQKGYITQDQLEELVISEKLSSEQIEDLMTDLSGMGINITENEETEYSEEAQEQSSSKEIVAASTESESLDKTEGKTECMFLNVLPFLFSNKIPTRLMQISAFRNRSLIFFSSKIFASTISMYPAFAWVFIM